MDPVLIPVQLSTPQRFIHLVVGTEAAAFQIVRCHRMACILHCPASQHVVAEQPLFISRFETVGAIDRQHHSLDLGWNDVCNGPAGQGQIAGSEIADALCPGLVVEPLQGIAAIRALIDVGFPMSLALARTAAGLDYIAVAPAGQFCSVDLIQRLLIGIAAALDQHRELCKPLRFEDLGIELHSVLHGQHQLLPAAAIDRAVVGHTGIFLPVALLRLPHHLFHLTLLLLGSGLFFFLCH